VCVCVRVHVKYGCIYKVVLITGWPFGEGGPVVIEVNTVP